MGKKRHESSSSESSDSDSESSNESARNKKKLKLKAKSLQKEDRKNKHHHKHKKERLELEKHQGYVEHNRDRSRAHHQSEGDGSKSRYESERDKTGCYYDDTNKRSETEKYRSRSCSEQRKRSDEHTRMDDRERERQDRNDTRDKNAGYGRHYPNERDERTRRQRDNRRRSSSFDHAEANWGKESESKDNDSKKTAQDKEKPNFKLSGKLTEETNMYKGVVIKYSEPPEARKPRRRWRLYPFKGDKALQTLYIHRESAYLIGRERKIVDLPVDHPSCSKQHAALQYRLVPFTREDGSVGKRVRPYIIDLESANGTFINNKKIEPKKYVELLEKDVIKFGFSSREYVLLHENSKEDALDDDVFPEEQDLIEIKKEEKD